MVALQLIDISEHNQFTEISSMRKSTVTHLYLPKKRELCDIESARNGACFYSSFNNKALPDFSSFITIR